MAKTLEQLVVELSAEVGSFRREMRVAGGVVRDNTRRMEQDAKRVDRAFGGAATAAKALGAAVVAIGATRAIRGLVQLTRSAIEQGGTLSDLAQQVGTTAEQYQAFQFTIRNTGGSLAAVQPGLVSFNRQMAELRVGSGTLAEFLKKADPEFAALLTNTTSTAEAVDLFADKIQSLTSQQDRLALAQAGFGRGGREFVNALSTGSTGLADMAQRARELGAVIDEDVVQRADAMNDAIGDLSQIALAQFANAALGAKEEGGDLLATLTDRTTIERVGDLASAVGELAGVLTRFAVAAAGAVQKAREVAFGFGGIVDLEGFDRATLEERLRVLREIQRVRENPSGIVDRLKAFAIPADDETLSRERVAADRARIEAELGRRDFVGPPLSPSAAAAAASATDFAPFFKAPPVTPGATGGAKSAGRDPLAAALSTLRAEQQAAEQVARERERFEQNVTRAFEQETLSREQLIERSRDRQIADLERLGFAEQEAADLRVQINATADAEIEKLGKDRFESLAEIGELAFETIGDFIATNLLGEAEASFGDLAASFARTLLRMQIAAAASNIGEILSEKLRGATASSSKGTTASGTLGLLGTLGKVLGFAQGGIVRGPVLAAIGENPATRPEVVAPLSDLQQMLEQGGGGAEISVVNAIPAVRATARRVPGRGGRDAFEIQLESALGALLSRGALKDQLGGRHAPGMS